MNKLINKLLCKLFGHISVDDVSWERANKFLEKYPEDKFGARCVRCGVKIRIYYG